MGKQELEEAWQRQDKVLNFLLQLVNGLLSVININSRLEARVGFWDRKIPTAYIYSGQPAKTGSGLALIEANAFCYSFLKEDLLWQ